MMTREEAIDIIENKIQIDVRLCTKEEVEQYQEALTMALTALRPVSREQVEKMWPGCINCHDKERLAKHIHCWPSFCPVCGKPLTNEAVQMVMERLEALKGV